MAAQADGTIYINTAINTDGMKAGGKEVEAAARRMAARVSGIGDAAKLALQKQADSFVRQNQLYAQQEQKVEALKAKLEEMKNLKIPADEFKAIGKQIDTDTAKLNKLQQTQEVFLATGGKTNSTAFKRRQMQIEELEASIQHAKSEQEELLRSGEAYKPVDTSAIEQKIIAEQEKLVESANRLGTAYEQLKYKVGGYGDASEEAENEIVGFADSVRNAFSLLRRGLTDIPKAGLELIVAGLGKIGKAAARAYLHLAKMVGSAVVSGFKKLGSAAWKAAMSISGIGSHAKKSDNMLKTSLKTILKYAFGIRSMYILFRKMRSAVKEGFSNLAQYSNETNQSISSLMSALAQLKNSMATAFNPILTVVAPALTMIINLASKAATAVGMFFSALTGKNSFVKALPVQKDYAAGLKDTAAATEKAEKATKRYLSGLDEVRQFESDKDDDGNAGTGADNVSAADMFETVPIDSKIKDIADKIKGFIRSEDWEGLGDYIASGINQGLRKVYDAISWNNVGPKITYFVNAFTRTFNSLVDNIDWNLLGQTIGAGINTIVNTLNLLIEGIDWQNLGAKFAEGIMGLVREVDWGNFGRLIGNKFMIGWNILYGLIMNLNYGEIGTAIGDGLNGAVAAINLGTVGAVLGRALTGLFETAISFADTFDWKGLGDNISNGINRFFEEFDGKKFGQAATKLISGILDTLIETIATTDWTAVGRDIVDFIVNINWLELAGKLAIAALALIGGLVYGLVTAIAETDWGAVWDSIVQAFKDFFGIHSPSKLMEDLGILLMEGLFNGLSALIDKVVSIFQDIKTKVSEKWEETKTVTIEKWNTIKQTVTGKWNEIKSNATQKFSEMKTNISGKWEEMKTNAVQKWEEIKSRITGIWNNMKSTASQVWQGIVGVIKSPINSIIRLMNGLISGMASAVNGMARMINSLSFKIPDWLGGGSLSFNLPTWNPGRIPYLASGAVIPPNAPFMAMLGDQKAGNNLEMPESLLRKIIKEETGDKQGGSDTIVLKVYLSGKQIMEDVVKQGKVEQMASGKNVFALG